MRGLRRRLRPRRDERGAVLLLVAAFSVAMFVLAAFVIDIGHTRESKREVTLSTDAAVLAAASLIDHRADLDPATFPRSCDAVPTKASATAENPAFTDVGAVVDWYLEANGGTAAVRCEVHWNGAAGHITVAGGRYVEYTMGGATGVDGATVAGVSTALFGEALDSTYHDGGGLRSMAVCRRSFEAVAGRALGDGPADFEAVPFLLTTEHLKHQPDCGGGNGNNGAGQFGAVNYDGGNSSGGQHCSPGEPNQCSYAWYGYFGEVEQDVHGSPGNAFKSQSQAYEHLVELGQRFLVPVYDSVTGNGANTTLHLTHYLEVILTDFTGQGDFEMTVHRSYPFTSTPPLTSDGGWKVVRAPLRPRLCSFSDAPTGEECAVPTPTFPEDPDDGGSTPTTPSTTPTTTTTTTTVPSSCTVTGVTMSTTTPDVGSNRKLKDHLTASVRVADATRCANLTAQLSSSSGTNVSDQRVQTGNRFDFRWDANGERFPEDLYTLYVKLGSSTLSSSVTVRPQ